MDIKISRHSKQRSCSRSSCLELGRRSERTFGRCTPLKHHWHSAFRYSALKRPAACHRSMSVNEMHSLCMI